MKTKDKQYQRLLFHENKVGWRTSSSLAHTSSKRFINSYSSPKHNICVNWQPFLHRTNYPHLYGPYNNSRADMHWDIFCVCPLTIFKHCCINHSVSSTLFFSKFSFPTKYTNYHSTYKRCIDFYEFVFINPDHKVA